MLRIHHNGIPYDAPESWAECTLAQLRRVLTYFHHLPADGDELTLTAGLLHALTGAPPDALGAQSLTAARRVAQALTFVRALPESDVSEFTFRGVRYRRSADDLARVEFRQYVDASFIVDRAARNGDALYADMHRIAALFFLPVDAPAQTYAERAALFDDLPADVAWGAFNFFCAVAKASEIVGAISLATATTTPSA